MQQRRLAAPLPGAADDHGAADPALAEALTAYDAEPGATAHHDVLAALLEARLLVPVVAVLGEVEVDDRGLATDKSSDMATVLLTGADGRTALLAFTSIDTLQAWDPAARPVPATARTVAATAIQDGAAALVLDVAGPARLVVEGDDLVAIAAGARLSWLAGRSAWVGATIGPAPE